MKKMAAPVTVNYFEGFSYIKKARDVPTRSYYIVTYLFHINISYLREIGEILFRGKDG